jgi:hypothetical protein
MSTKIIDRVKKMLALANDSSASEGERDNALRMAHATLTKYNLDIEDLDVKEGRECMELFGFSSPWQVRVSNSISKLFFCKYYFARGPKFTHTFVGKTSNVVTAQMMADYVIRSVRREAAKRQRSESLPNSWYTSFCKGASVTIMDRCNALRVDQETNTESNGTALVVTELYKTEEDLNSAFIKDMLNLKLKSAKSKEHRAGYGYNDGKDYGNNINLSGQIGNNSNTLRIGN